jgi:hemerythrin-like domain-containing protein
VVQAHAVPIALDQAKADPHGVPAAENADMTQTSRISLPGVHSPDAGFSAPFEMLAACHERVQRSLDLMRRLVDHLAAQGCDDSARSAAHDVWRYFEVAAPAHHADEELHVLPRLRHSGDAKLMAAAEQIHADHQQLDAIWLRLGPHLHALSQPASRCDAATLEALRNESQAFLAVHERHVPLEDTLVFPAAQARTDAAALQAMGLEMAARRLRAD